MFNTKLDFYKWYIDYIHDCKKPPKQRKYPKQRTEEWLAQRKWVITASEIASIFEMNHFKSMSQYILDKAAGGKFDPNPYTIFGNRNESISCMDYITKWESVFPGKKLLVLSLPLLINPNLSEVGASLDGICVELTQEQFSQLKLLDNFTEDTLSMPPVTSESLVCLLTEIVSNHTTIPNLHIIEIKSPYRRKPKDGMIPEDYRVQMQLQIETAGKLFNHSMFNDVSINEYLIIKSTILDGHNDKLMCLLNDHIDKPILYVDAIRDYLSHTKICYIPVNSITPHPYDIKTLPNVIGKSKHFGISEFSTATQFSLWNCQNVEYVTNYIMNYINREFMNCDRSSLHFYVIRYSCIVKYIPSNPTWILDRSSYIKDVHKKIQELSKTAKQYNDTSNSTPHDISNYQNVSWGV